MINYKNTFGAEIRNKVAVIQGSIEILEQDKGGLKFDGIRGVCKDLVKIADKLKDMPIEPKYKDLGEGNSWVVGEYPHEYIMCMTAEHELQEIKLNDAGTYREYRCPKCLIFWKTDSSD